MLLVLLVLVLVSKECGESLLELVLVLWSNWSIIQDVSDDENEEEDCASKGRYSMDVR